MKDKDYLGSDKIAHMLCCMIIAIVHPYLAIGAALGKEYGDYKSPFNHWCWWDILADAAGILIGSVIWYFRPKLM